MMTWKEFIRPTNLTPVMDEDDDLVVVIRPSEHCKEVQQQLAECDAQLTNAKLMIAELNDCIQRTIEVLRR